MLWLMTFTIKRMSQKMSEHSGILQQKVLQEKMIAVPLSQKLRLNPPNKSPSIRVQKDHPKELIIGDLNSGVITRSREVVSNSCFVSKIEPKNVKEALTDEFWINAM